MKISKEKRERLWNKLERSTDRCDACVLRKTRRKAVLCRGAPLDADWCFLAEAPGEDEDRRGVALVGEAGKLFDRYLEDAKIPTDKWVAINTLNCRPPGNKYPGKEVASICIQRYLWVKLDIIRPKILVLMGKRAAECFFKIGGKMGDVAGDIFEPSSEWKAPYLRKVCVTYHPAFALRQPHVVGLIRSHLRFFRAYIEREGLLDD